MSDLIHIISWERYCEKDNNNDLDKYMELPLQNYPGLLDIRNLNLKNSGPLLKDLPDNCLNVLTLRLRVLVENENLIDSPNRIVSLTKMLCLIARNGKNFLLLEEVSVPNLMVKLIDLSLLKLSKAMNGEWLNLLEYSLYFLEIIYDPIFTWRRRKKLFYSESAQIELINPTTTKSMEITVENATWLCSQLIIYFDDRDIRTRLLHLLCVIASGGKDNAQFIISPATVDAFKFDGDSNVNIETIVSYCCLIYCLSEIPMAERQEDLPTVVKKLIEYVISKPEIRISELRCLYQLILVNYELSAELIRCGILNVIKICLTNTQQDPEQCRFCFLLLSKLTSGEFQAQNQFIESRGYDELFTYLTSNPLQAAFLLDLIFTWAVAEPFDASKLLNKQYIIRDGNVIGLLIKWGTNLSFIYERETELSDDKNSQSQHQYQQPVVNWRAIFKLIVELCHKSRCSISECCENGVIVVITECIQQACCHIDTCIPEVINHDDEILCQKLSTIQRKCDELLKGLFHMLEIFCFYSFQGRDLKAVMRLFKDRYTRTRSRKLIKIFIKVISERDDEIKCWFELSQPGDCISIAPVINKAEFSMKNNFNNYLDRRLSPQTIMDAITWKISSYGFSFHCWLNISQLSVTEKVDAGHERSCLFRLLTEANNGFEAFLNMDGQLIVATCHQGEFHYAQICNNSKRKTQFMVEESFLKTGKWHMLNIVFQNAKGFFSKPSVMVYVNGVLVDTVELKYPIIVENINIFHIGGCPKNLLITNKNLLDLKSKRKSTFMSSNSVKKTFLSEEHHTWGRLSTLRCRIAGVACINDVLPETVIGNLFQRGPLDTQAILNDETLLGNILINYHARAFDCNDNVCFNLHSYIQSSRSNKFHAGYLTGQWLQCHKFEDVINEIGGLSCILPIIEQLEFIYFKVDSEIDQENSDGYHFDEIYSSKESSRNSLSIIENEGFITVPDKVTEMNCNESSILASIVTLIRKLISFERNQQQIENMKFIHIMGALLQKVEISLLDKKVVLAFRSLADLCSINISSQIYKFILLDWRIWSRCTDEIRLQHCLFVLDLVKSDRIMFRQQYGLSLLLDVLYFHHRPYIVNQEDVHKKLRDQIYSMIFHLIHKHITIQDYQNIMKLIHETNEDSMIQECLELLTKLFNASDNGHQDFLLLYENHLMESLFVLLIKNLSVQTKEETIKFLHLIITSSRIPDKFKSHLLLNEISFASIFTFTEFCQAPLSPGSIQNLLEIIRKAASRDLFGVIQFLSLLTLSPMKQRISSIRMLKSFFDKSPEAILEISKQPGWQDILIHLLVLNKKKEKESVSSLNENDKNEDVNVKSKEINSDVKGFRRSSTLVFDEPANECLASTSSKFDNVLEEDEDEYPPSEQFTDNIDIDENLENKSIDTVFLRQMTSSGCEMNTEESSLNLSMTCFHRRSICTSMTGSDDISQQLKLGNGLMENCEKDSVLIDVDILKEELIDLVLECLHKVMWQVLSSSNDKDSWMVVHQVIESLRSVNERYTLLDDISYFKEKLLICILNSFIDQYKTSDNLINRLPMHSKELIYLIVDNNNHNIGSDSYGHKTQLLDQTMVFMQECLQVWEEDNLWPELAALGFFYLLSTLSCDSNHDIVSAVCARLHQIITSISKNINYEEIAFIIVHLDRVLKQMISSDNYYSVALILKTLLEYYGEVLQISAYLPNMSIKAAEFFDDFKTYSSNEEWQNFIKSRLISACEIYETNYLNEMTTSQSLWRAQANEKMSLDRRIRLSLSKNHRKRFENEIITMTTKWIKDERKRRNCVEKDLKMQHEATLRLWRVTKQYLTSSKGCWHEKLNKQNIYWKQSCRENYLRMRPRFDPNYQYDQHLDASKERDFPSHSYKETEPNPLLYLSSLEGKIDFSALGDDQLGDDEWITVQNTGLSSSLSGSIQNPSSGLSPSNVKKSTILECRCKLIKFTEVVEGKFELTNTHFIFHGINFSIDALDSNTSQMVNSINQIREIHLRRYNLRRSAIEIFLTDQTNYFFNFTTKTRNRVYSKILSLRPQNLIYSKPRSPADILKSSNLTQKWVNREISNFEYLMQLNTIAGRTYNDMSQYPVFPWIISDYTSPKLDLNNSNAFRDLSKPIGVVNPKNEPEIREKYDGFEDPTGVVPQFHYGTHYSSAAGVMHYMVRVEPFTTMHIQLQSGKFDVADRQFHSIPMAWNFIMESPNDNKELIPEFFYEPEFLRNQNNFQFGLLQQTKTPIDDVELPAWASSPEDFIYQHQQALESEYVSQNLHNWIDLIFGYKQKGPEAVKALNVFYYVTYEGVVDLDQISDPVERESIESMINNFGQTPCQLLKHPHPRRLTESEERTQVIKIDKYLPVLSNIYSLKHTSKSVCSNTEPIVFVRVPVSQTKGFIGTDKSLSMITIHSSNIIAKHNWLPNYKSTGSNFHIDLDQVLDNLTARRKNFLGPLSSFVESSNKIYDVSPDCKYIIAGGNIENRLTIMAIKKSEVYHVPTPHHLPVSCVSIDIDCTSFNTIFNGSLAGVGTTSTSGVRLYAISGSLDSTCVVWNLSDLPSTSVVQILCGHSSAVSSVSLSMYLDVALTGSEDGTVNLHSVIRGQFLHTITPGLLNSATLSINFVVLTRFGQIYVQWQNGFTPSKDKSKSSFASCSANHPKQFLSLYSLHANHISTCELGHSKVTVLNVVPKSLGSLNNCCLVGNVKGELIILDGYDLIDQKTLNFQNSIFDVQLLSPSGQHLVVALSNGCLIISTVSLSNIDK